MDSYDCLFLVNVHMVCLSPRRGKLAGPLGHYEVYRLALRIVDAVVEFGQFANWRLINLSRQPCTLMGYYILLL